MERDRACRDLSLGLCPSSALLAKRFAARLLEYPPSGVRLIRPASVTCGHLHRDPMDLIRFSRFAGLSPPPLRIESNPSGAFALRCQALLHNSVSGQTGWAREATPCHLPGQGATPWLYSPTGEWLPPSFTAHDGRTASRPARAHVISATPASHFRYTWVSQFTTGSVASRSSFSAVRCNPPRFEVLPHGGVYCRCRKLCTIGARLRAPGLGLGALPLGGVSRETPRGLPAGVSSRRHPFHLPRLGRVQAPFHRGLMDSIQFSKNVF